MAAVTKTKATLTTLQYTVPMDDLRFKLMGIQWEHASIAEQASGPSWLTLLCAVLIVCAFSMWAVTLFAIARSERNRTIRKIVWAAAALALPVLGSVLWLVSGENAPAGTE